MFSIVDWFMKAVDSFIPFNVENVRDYFYKAGNRPTMTTNRITAGCTTIICSMSNAIFYNVGLAYNRVAVFTSQATTYCKEKELDCILFRIFNIKSEKFDQSIKLSVSKQMVVVNDREMETFEDLKNSLQEFLIGDDIQKLFVLLGYRGFSDYLKDCTRDKIKKVFECIHEIKEKEWPIKLCITLKKRHIKMQGFINYSGLRLHGLNDRNFNKVHFSIKCTYAIDFNFELKKFAKEIHFIDTTKNQV